MAKYATTEETINCQFCMLDFSVRYGKRDIRGGIQMYITDGKQRFDLYKFTCPRCEAWLGSRPLGKEHERSWLPLT